MAHSRQCLLEVRNQVINSLDANGQPQPVLGDGTAFSLDDLIVFSRGDAPAQTILGFAHQMDCRGGLPRLLSYKIQLPPALIPVDLHVQLIRFYKDFALKSDPVSDWKPLVISMSFLVIYGTDKLMAFERQL